MTADEYANKPFNPYEILPADIANTVWPVAIKIANEFGHSHGRRAGRDAAQA